MKFCDWIRVALEIDAGVKVKIANVVILKTTGEFVPVRKH